MTAPLTTPGLFITGTDTEVGKTVVTCAIAAALRRTGLRVGVCKPIASGCRLDVKELVSEDAEALAHFADSPFPLHTINPVRYRAPLAPAVAADKARRPVDISAIDKALSEIAQPSDVMLVEGVGGWLVPIDDKHTVGDLARRIGYPVVVVARANLGTLNHTALTCESIKRAGLKLAGIVVNGFDAEETVDESMADNPAWLARQSKTRVLATVPRCDGVAPNKGHLPLGVLDAIDVVDWRARAKPARRS